MSFEELGVSYGLELRRRPSGEAGWRRLLPFGVCASPGHQVISDSGFYGPNSVARGSEGGFLLDGLELHNVVFNGVTLRYHGGFLLTKNVWFVNCTFQVEQSVKGNQFLEVAALGQTSASIG